MDNFIKFLIIGGINTTICMIVFKGLIYISCNYLITSALMNIFGIVEGYFLNCKFVYNSSPNFKELSKYFYVYAVSFCLNLVIMYLLVGKSSIAELPAQITTTAILTVLNYLLVKVFVFTNKKNHKKLHFKCC